MSASRRSTRYENRGILRSASPGDDAAYTDPQGPPRRRMESLVSSGCHWGTSRRRRCCSYDGGGTLQRRLGTARRPAVFRVLDFHKNPSTSPARTRPAWSEGRRQDQALEGGRRGDSSTAIRRTAATRSAMAETRALGLAEDLGLRDARRKGTRNFARCSGQLMEKPATSLGGERLLHADAPTASACSSATSPHTLKRRTTCWSGAPRAGSGVFGVQLCAAAGANAIGIISDDRSRDLRAPSVFGGGGGAKGVINRKDFSCWGQMPQVGNDEYNAWAKEAVAGGLRQGIWGLTGKEGTSTSSSPPGEATFRSRACGPRAAHVWCSAPDTTGFT